jgi:hypothetical protein
MSTPLRFQDLPSDIIYMIREVLQDDFQALRCLWQLDRRCYRITLPKILEKVSSNDLTKLANIVPPENRQMYADLIRMLKVKKRYEQVCSHWTLPTLQFLYIGSDAKLCTEWHSPLFTRGLQKFRCDSSTLPLWLLNTLSTQCPDLQSFHLCGPETHLANGISLGKVLGCLTNLQSIDLTGTSESTNRTFFRDIPDHVSQNLRELSLRDRLMGESAKYFADFLSKTTKLHTLDFSHSLNLSADIFNVEFLSSLLNMTTLRRLVLTNKLEDKMVRALLNSSGRPFFYEMTHLGLEGESEALSTLLTSPFLTHLDFTLFDPQPKIYHAISKLPRLQSLKLSFMSKNASLDSRGMQAISSLAKLESLTFQFSREDKILRFTAGDCDIELFGSLPKLERLYLGKRFAKHHHLMESPVR